LRSKVGEKAAGEEQKDIRERDFQLQRAKNESSVGTGRKTPMLSPESSLKGNAHGGSPSSTKKKGKREGTREVAKRV